jgi:para-aminobenzoate synthetase / 4-amino-4-deoxychorismate lyase
MRATLVRRPIDSAIAPTAALRALAGLRDPFALTGAWAGGGVVMGAEPLEVVEGEAVFDAIDRLPAVEGDGIGGGWFGYLGYQLGRAVERIPAPRSRPHPLPDGRLAYYDHVVRYDEAARQWSFEALWTPERADAIEAAYTAWRRRLSAPPPALAPHEIGDFLITPSRAEHEAAIERGLEHIAAGDVFQINLTLRLEASFRGDPLAAFTHGLPILRPRFGAYFAFDGAAIASFSPELFLRRQGRVVLTSPIKGTIERHGDGGADELVGSAKNRAENIMIVDLMRNDLGRVCRFGTIGVPALHRPEAHPGVWHLVSDVEGVLRSDVTDSMLLRAAFPPGSCTGAPKVRAMQLINELEPTGREAYTGAIGFAGPLAGLQMNVAIRTFEFADGRVWLGAGGGIVADSRPDDEFDECLVKARPLVAALSGNLVGNVLTSA